MTTGNSSSQRVRLPFERRPSADGVMLSSMRRRAAAESTTGGSDSARRQRASGSHDKNNNNDNSSGGHKKTLQWLPDSSRSISTPPVASAVGGGGGGVGGGQRRSSTSAVALQNFLSTGTQDFKRESTMPGQSIPSSSGPLHHHHHHPQQSQPQTIHRGSLGQEQQSNRGWLDGGGGAAGGKAHFPVGGGGGGGRGRAVTQLRQQQRSRIYDDPMIVAGYNSVPSIELDRLPRGGISLDTKAIGRIQFGIPPETIKDSMLKGYPVPQVYIVPVERFSREMGPALGINLAEFEFPSYFNYFVRNKRCTLVVDSVEAEYHIRRVFGETLLGPAQFRDHSAPKPNEEEDFDPSFPREARPNFYKEFYHFRTAEKSTNYQELTIDTLIEFCHFMGSKRGGSGTAGRRGGTRGGGAAGGGIPASSHDRLGIPPPYNPHLMVSILGDGSGVGGGAAAAGGGPEPVKTDTSGMRRHTTVLNKEATIAIMGESFNESINFADAYGGGAGGALWMDDVVDDQHHRHHDDMAGVMRDLSEGGGAGGGSGGGGSGGLGGAGGDGNKPVLRRTMSNPNLRKARQVVGYDPRKSFSNPTNTEGGAGNNSNASFQEDDKFSPTLSSHPDSGRSRMTRRGSVDTAHSVGGGGNNNKESAPFSGRDGISYGSSPSLMMAIEDEEDPGRSTWMYSQAKWLGDVATIYPQDATEEQKANNTCARVEIFKMTGGTEYIIHDVDENNIIVGKARFSGTVRVPDEIAVEGFLASTGLESEADDDIPIDDTRDVGSADGSTLSFMQSVEPPTFHPPSFGVTVLGNSHGFDKNGSVSGYVLWINGRGIMIDPPPYSSATLEREGIRPQMIMAIIITHCHADHDAGTFQKVMTGSRVAIITTPTIYRSFIRKYAALSGLSPTLLRHSHRHRPAIIGQPLKFQGATFHFTYTLHTIPCIAFKVIWRLRSMVFTGDHLNSPPVISMLEEKGVLTKERADDLRRLPLQDCDLLLHEAGAPPIHTPLAVLKALPEVVKKRLKVVHTSALPPDSGLSVAPAGTAKTMRLDRLQDRPMKSSSRWSRISTDSRMSRLNGETNNPSSERMRESCESNQIAAAARQMSGLSNSETALSADYYSDKVHDEEYMVPTMASRSDVCTPDETPKSRNMHGKSQPLVFRRPASVSDAWFILNLLSNVPFLSSLSYSHTMEVLEIAQVEAFFPGEVVLSAARRPETLCVVWEGTCVERAPLEFEDDGTRKSGLEEQEGAALDAASNVELGELVIESVEALRAGAKLTVWHAGDWTGPVALQPDADLSVDRTDGREPCDIVALSQEGVKVIMLNMTELHQILKSGSKLFRKYLALKEKQAAEEAAMQAQMLRNEVEVTQALASSEDPGHHVPESSPQDQMPHNWYSYDSVLEVLKCNSALGRLTALQKRHLESVAEGPRFFEAGSYLWQVGEPVDYAFLIVAGTASFAQKAEEQTWTFSRRGSTGTMSPAPQVAQPPSNAGGGGRGRSTESGPVSMIEEDKPLLNVSPNSEYARLEAGLQLRVEEMELDIYEQSKELLPKEQRMRNARDRFANKVLARLYSRRAYTTGLVFSRGHLLSDTSRMVSGSLAHIHHTGNQENMGSMGMGLASDHHCHTSNMMAQSDGCVVMIFPRAALVQFLDGNPGVLLSLLGTQVAV